MDKEEKKVEYPELIYDLIFVEALMVFISIPVYHMTGAAIAALPILFGIVATSLSGRINSLVTVDFAHLTERAMLYVVFTFGEMIIAVSGYFEGEIGFNTIYFSIMGFLIVVGLFLCYGTIYDHLIDREMTTNGTGYICNVGTDSLMCGLSLK